MTLHLFHLLAPPAQLLYTLHRGTYLAQREQAGDNVKLYYLPDQGRGFFIEVGYNAATQAVGVRRSFRSSEPLAAYAQLGYLPEP